MTNIDPAIVEAVRDPQTLTVLAVGHTLDAICDCSADEPDGEATDPNTGERIPHHYDCAAVEAWPAVSALIAAAVDAARAEGDKQGAARVREAVEAWWLREDGVPLDSADVARAHRLRAAIGGTP